MILLLYVPVTTVQLEEHKHIEIQRVLNFPPLLKRKDEGFVSSGFVLTFLTFKR